MDLLNKGINPLSFQGLKTSVTTDDSRAINFDEDCKVIISASGMCDAGRIKHHLKHNLWNPRNTILLLATRLSELRDGIAGRCCGDEAVW